MEQAYPGKIFLPDSISTPRSTTPLLATPHLSGTGCIDGIGHDKGRIRSDGRKWVITYQRGTCAWPNYEWECDTDVPVILFAYLGTHAPWKKKGTHVKRGVVYHHAAKIYFPYDLISCQNEEDEVTEHTFTWPLPDEYGRFVGRPPGDDVLFWWRCGGLTTGLFPPLTALWSASRSPFYNAHCRAPAYIPACYTENHLGTAGVHRSVDEFSRRFTPLKAFTANKLTFSLCRGQLDNPPISVFYRIYELEDNEKPIGSAIREGTVTIAPPLYPSFAPYTASFPNITFDLTKKYSIAFKADIDYPQYQWYNWRQENGSVLTCRMSSSQWERRCTPGCGDWRVVREPTNWWFEIPELA